MSSEIPKHYDPRAAETRWFPFWEQAGYFDANPHPQRQPHVIMIPLPNVTGALHMGHALNCTLQDVLTRWRRMQGYEALWMPGTDHAGIATQAVVERRLYEQEGLTRHDIGRDALVARIWKWKDEYEQRILGQLKRLGASCDWRRVRFTLDEVCSRAVRRTFFKMFRDGLIYRGKRLVNWDTYLQTAVADDEVYTEDTVGQFWTFAYPVVDDSGHPSGETIAFSTTRPETMLGDTALCVHPNDARYRHLIGKYALIPLNDRLIPIIADPLLADPQFGTGCVKVTPAHDPNDYTCGLRHHLPMINILNPDGTLNEHAGRWKGLDRYAARQSIIQEMERLGLYKGSEERVIPLKFSDRSKTPIEPYLSDQWFVRMSELAESAIQAVREDRVQFFPARYAETYLDWLSEKRDWCISRQLWWGHRIPIWSREADRDEFKTWLACWGYQSDVTEHVSFAPPWHDKLHARYDAENPQRLLVCVDHGAPEIERQLEQLGFKQDEDVLDTWFSSALWPHATLGWPDLEHDPPLIPREGTQVIPERSPGNHVLRYFYPGSVLVTSRDIITLWVARMVLTGLYNMGDVPFHHVHVHPKILDGFGQGMSKSKGNGVDPLDLIDRYGCDGVRFTITSFAGETQDVRLPISYACPHCDALIPQTLEHQRAKPQEGRKPTVRCPKCRKESQYTSAHYDPDPGSSVARMISERFEYGRNFCNKLWNACRFVLLNLEDYQPAPITSAHLMLEDRWILSRLQSVCQEITRLLDRYQFDAATRTLREFVWNEFCDWYLEAIKYRLREERHRTGAQQLLVLVTDVTLRLLHPFVPFITEEIWQRLMERAPLRPDVNTIGNPNQDWQILVQPAAEACIIARWPQPPGSWLNNQLEERYRFLQEIITALRNIRSLYNIAPQHEIRFSIRCHAQESLFICEQRHQISALAKAQLIEAGPEVTRPAAAAAFTLPQAEGYVPLEGLIDRVAELARQQKEAQRLAALIQSQENKLSNPQFIEKAPEPVVAEVRENLERLRQQLASVQSIIHELQG